MTGPAVTSLKLLAQATGEYTREELNKVAKLGWTDAAAKQIAEAAPRRAAARRLATTPRAVAALTLVARPFRVKETDLK